MNDNYYDFERNFSTDRRIPSSFGYSKNDYLLLDRETRLLLQKAYWEQINETNKENAKRKVLSIFKRK